MEQKKRKSLFNIFEEMSSNFVDGIREGLANLNNIISNVVEFMELAGDIKTADIIEKGLQRVEIEGEEIEDEEIDINT
ncbi:MAG: hypothetical protein ACTSO9_03325 [Candidatus Helarchaeota archaeon]